ncbi:hypothetical protein LT85_1766 [Collimonas arenae]|uniref:Uncharacterized protein n=1 Tax=Collimonas arenae TaxID=279058 RepID=A0A0A1FB73_9BURK|nr:hypothetical protein LT85_1766 [Collimonas arenae]
MAAALTLPVPEDGEAVQQQISSGDECKCGDFKLSLAQIMGLPS